MKNSLKNGVCILLILMFILSLFQNIVLATNIGDSPLIKYDRNCELNLQYKNSSMTNWSYVTCSFVYYEKNGVRYPAYCLDKGLPGVGDTSSGSSLNRDPYNVNITELMSDVRLWRVAINGYPYKTPEQMGLVDKYDAFLATKQSIYCILYGTEPSTYFRGPNARGQAIKDAIVRLVNEGRNGTQTPSNVEVKVNKVGNFVEDGDYYSQEYLVQTFVDTSEYTITSTSGLPSGSKITNMSNVEKNTYSANEHFKIRIPKTKLKNNLNAVIAVQAKCKTYPVFFGETTIPGTQDYLITYDPFGDTGGITTLNVTVQGKLSFQKISADNNIWTGHVAGSGVAGGEYIIKNASGQIVKTLVTNANGKAEVSLSPGKYTIYESKSPPNFEIDSNVYEFEITHHGSLTNFRINEKVVAGGYFSAKKVSAANNIWTGHRKDQALQGSRYGLYDINGNLIDTKTSTSDGTLWNNYKLKNGKYYVLELSCPKWFEIDNNKYWFEIENNEQKITMTAKDKVVEGGYFSARKTSSLNNIWTGHKVNDPVSNATYGIFTLDDNIVEIDGNQAISKSDENGVIFDNYKLTLRRILYERN